MAFTLCSSAAIITKAGANASSTAIASLALLTQFSNEAEGEIMAISRKNWVADIGSISSRAITLLAEYCSAHAGSNVITYDMSGFTSRDESRLMLNFLDQRMKIAASLLRDKQVETYLGT